MPGMYVYISTSGPSSGRIRRTRPSGSYCGVVSTFWPVRTAPARGTAKLVQPSAS